MNAVYAFLLALNPFVMKSAAVAAVLLAAPAAAAEDKSYVSVATHSRCSRARTHAHTRTRLHALTRGLHHLLSWQAAARRCLAGVRCGGMGMRACRESRAGHAPHDATCGAAQAECGGASSTPASARVVWSLHLLAHTCTSTPASTPAAALLASCPSMP
ncbi:MAG: hypothetical protein EOO41_03280 [Methanobacteriota archaeon]|nr:MAG: hypothetical protein EOO41_03280 [Euryarchaeota archaeon]